MILHWISALAVVGMFASGLWMVDLTYYSDWYKTAPHWHKSVGLILLAITVIRLVARIVTTRPPSYGTHLEKGLSHAAHGLLYTLIIALFASGYLISTADGRGIDVFNWFSVPAIGELIERISYFKNRKNGIEKLRSVKYHLGDDLTILNNELKNLDFEIL